MSTLKVIIGHVEYDRKTRSRKIEIISESERDYRERARKELDRKIRAKKNQKSKKLRKSKMHGSYLKKVYGR